MDRIGGPHDLKRPGLRWGAIGVALAALGATAIVARGRHTANESAANVTGPEGSGTRVGSAGGTSAQVGYEMVDTNVGALIKIMIVAIGLGAASLAAVFWMFASFNMRHQHAGLGVTAEQRQAIVPPLPHLQAEPYRDIDTTVAQQRQRIETYGWEDFAHQRAHIPIERAMRQIVGKSLDPIARSEGASPPGMIAPVPELPGQSAARPQDKPANQVQGEGRPGTIAPSYDPRETREPKP